MKKLTFRKLAQLVLKQAGKPLSQSEIWEFAKSKGLDKAVGTQGKTPDATIGAIIYKSIKNSSDSEFIKIGAKFSLKDQFKPIPNGAVDISSKPDIVIKADYAEKDLHPFLAYFGQKQKIYMKTIDHTKSSKKEFSEWIHPDMVGCNYTLLGWGDAVRDLSKGIGSISIKLYSFEIKKNLDFQNLRASFFQAVSNSSWAHEGYLVAGDISKADDFKDELKKTLEFFWNWID